MDEQVARALLERELQPLRAVPYADLVAMIDRETAYDVPGPDGKTYQIEVCVFWDDTRGGDVRATVAIHDGGWRAFVPLTDSFIKAPSGDFVGE
jgi:hypothetical protein